MGQDLKIPIGHYGEILFAFVTAHFQVPVAIFSSVVLFLYGCIFSLVSLPPPLVWVVLAAAGLWCAAGWRLGVFALIGLLILWNQGLWRPTLETLSLVLTATIFSLAVALPIGVVIGESAVAFRVLNPVLDFIQTMPRFVYLIPAVILFGIDIVPAVFATMTLAVVPPIRIVALGIRQVDGRVVEAAEAFGSTRLAVIFKIKLPLARSALMLAANQCLMMALSMAVISALIGAGGLGANVLGAISTLDAGKGFVAGFGILLLAILIDRLMTGLNNRVIGARDGSAMESTR